MKSWFIWVLIAGVVAWYIYNQNKTTAANQLAANDAAALAQADADQEAALLQTGAPPETTDTSDWLTVPLGNSIGSLVSGLNSAFSGTTVTAATGSADASFTTGSPDGTSLGFSLN
jgi:hypothetical protein